MSACPLNALPFGSKPAAESALRSYTDVPASGLQRLVRQSPARYAVLMTRALESVFSQLSSLPVDEQDRIAGWLRSELESEQGWSQRFAASEAALNALADEALADALAGRTTPIDPEKM
jgi:hypothetical protein